MGFGKNRYVAAVKKLVRPLKNKIVGRVFFWRVERDYCKARRYIWDQKCCETLEDHLRSLEIDAYDSADFYTNEEVPSCVLNLCKKIVWGRG